MLTRLNHVFQGLDVSRFSSPNHGTGRAPKSTRRLGNNRRYRYCYGSSTQPDSELEVAQAILLSKPAIFFSPLDRPYHGLKTLPYLWSVTHPAVDRYPCYLFSTILYSV